MTPTYNTEFGLIEVLGEKSIPFLQGQLSANIHFPEANQVIFAVHCNPKGRVLCSFILFQYQQSIYLVTLRSIIPNIIAHLNRYAMLFRVSLRDQSNALPMRFAVKTNQNQPDWNWTSQLTERGVVIQNNHLILTLNEPIDETSSIEITPAEWHGHTLRMGFPWINNHTSAQFLPHELALQHTPVLSFDKGCYTGQEIIARMHYKGRVKTMLRQFLIDRIPDYNLHYYTDAQHTSEVMLVDFTNYQNKILICLLFHLEQQPAQQLYLSNHTLLPLEPLHEK